MDSLKTEPPSPVTIYVKEEHETLPECSNAEFNCVDCQPIEFKNEPETKNALKQQEHLLEHQKDQSLKHQEHSLNHQPEINLPSNSAVSDKEFCDKSELTMKAHSRGKPFQCPTCQKCFVKRSLLRQHSLIHETANFFCEVCDKEFTTTNSDFRSHMQQHYKPVRRGLFKCEHCSQCFSLKKKLMSHYRVEHPPSRVLSEKEFCENTELTEQEALVVREQRHVPDIKGPFKCKHCPKHYTHESSLIRHCRMEHPTQKRVFSDTEFCEKRKLTNLEASEKNESNKTESSIATVMSDEAIKKVVDNHKDNVLLEFDIPISDKGFGERREENETTTECTNAKFNCTDSQPVEFKLFGRLWRAFYKHPRGDQRRETTLNIPAECSHCNNQLTECCAALKNEAETKNALKQQEHLLEHQEHSLNHQPEINHPSNSAVSDEETSEPTMKANSRDKPFTCPTCHKCFTREYHLRRHSLIHEATYFYCEVCHKEFTTTKGDFKSHLQQHYKPVNKGLFKCEHCPKHYTHKRNLMRHCRMEHPPQKRAFYDTEFCEKRKPTHLVAPVKSEPNKTESTLDMIMSEEAVKKTVDGPKDNVLLQSDTPISDEGFGEKRELSKLVASIKSEASPETPYVNVNMEITEDYILPELDMPASDKEYFGKSEPSRETPYVNLEDDKFTVELKTEETNVDY